MATTKDYGIGGFTFPRGWFVAAEASEATKTPTALRYFGRDLIMYRGASGQVIVMDAYCPHMKTHLARNTTSYVVLDDEHVQGDDIVCPYHAWKFGPDGICKEIPYSPAPIPKDARIRTYPAREWGGLVLVWYDEEALEPNFEPPALPEWDDETWMNWTIDDLGEIDCHGQEVIDNIVDKAHLPPIHGSTNFQYFESEFKDHIAIQRLSAGHKTLSADILTNDTWYTGPGILLSRMEGDYSSIMLLAHTSVEDGRVKCWHGLLVKPPSHPPSAEDMGAIEAYQQASLAALSQDFEVWQNKAPCMLPMQVVGDGPFGKARTWYKQFYNPRNEIEKYQKAVNGVIVTRGTERDPFDSKSSKVA